MTEIRKTTPAPGEGYRVRNRNTSGKITKWTGLDVDADDTIIFAPAGTPPPDPEPEPPPPSGGGGSWGLDLMPLRSGWEVAFYTDFTEDGDRELGEGIGPHLANYFKPRRAMGDSSGRGTYDDRYTFSQHNGVADIFLHSSMTATGLQHDPMGKIHHVFALVDQIDRPEVIVQWTEECPTTPGRKQAPLLWAFGKNDNGECNHYEHKYGEGPRSNSFMHHYLKQTQFGKALNVVTTERHMLTMYHRSRGHRGANDPGEFTTWVDGQQRASWSSEITPNSMHHVMQIEAYLRDQPIPGWDSLHGADGGSGPGYNGTASSGHVLFDQIRIEQPA